MANGTAVGTLNVVFGVVGLVGVDDEQPGSPEVAVSCVNLFLSAWLAIFFAF